MPSVAIPMNPICDLTFVGQMKKLPVDWQQPTGDPAGTHYGQAFADDEKVAVPEPGCYFWPASTNKYHVDACKEIGGEFKDFAHRALDNTKTAIDLWRAQAKLQDLKVMAVCAIGAPGCLNAPSLKNCYTWVETSDSGSKYADAVMKGIADCWDAWAGKVMVPGLPLYPAFACFPSAMAPPMPSIPVPLISCPSPMMTKMTPAMLKQAMIDNLDSGLKSEDSDKQHEALFMAIGTAVATAFLGWLPMQQMMTVMGKGPIPTFAPPFVPVGPVLAGDNLPVPGHLGI